MRRAINDGIDHWAAVTNSWSNHYHRFGQSEKRWEHNRPIRKQIQWGSWLLICCDGSLDRSLAGNLPIKTDKQRTVLHVQWRRWWGHCFDIYTNFQRPTGRVSRGTVKKCCRITDAVLRTLKLVNGAAEFQMLIKDVEAGEFGMDDKRSRSYRE